MAVSEEGFDPKRIYCGGLPFRYTSEQIQEYWEYCGEVEEVDMMTFPDSGRFRGIAFITFKDPASATKALQYDGEHLDGYTLVVKPARPRRQQQQPRQRQDRAQQLNEDGQEGAQEKQEGTLGAKKKAFDPRRERKEGKRGD